MPAFPDAVGFGAHTVGGRSGRVLKVTTLDDGPPQSGPEGSLRRAIFNHNTGQDDCEFPEWCAAACPNPGTPCPSMLLFDVGGTIELIDELVVTAPNLTIAGHSAPGDGIALRASTNPDTQINRIAQYLLEIQSSEVIVQHIRIRPGIGVKPSGTLLGGIRITGEDAHHIILDHVSVSWAEDKALTIFRGARDITIQNSILAETLGCANHVKTLGGEEPCTGVYCCEDSISFDVDGVPHSRLITISTDDLEEGLGGGGGSPPPPSPTNITFYQNLLANTNRRFPNVTALSHVRVLNNRIHNYGAFGMKVHAGKNPEEHFAQVDYWGNWVSTGPWTAEYRERLEVLGPNDTIRYAVTADQVPSGDPTQLFSHEIYEDATHVDGTDTDIRDPDANDPINGGSGPLVEWQETWIAGDTEPVVPTLYSATSFDSHATPGSLPLDSADLRVRSEVACAQGTVVDDPAAEVGGWPALDPGYPHPPDSDGDGLSDGWEEQYDGFPWDPFDGASIPPGEVYSKLEYYLHQRHAYLVWSYDTSTDCTDDDPPSAARYRTSQPVSSDSVFLDWYEAKDRVGVAEYDIEYQPDGGSGWTPGSFGITTSEVVQDSLDPDTLYSFRVNAQDAVGNVSTSDVFQEMTLMAPVTGLAAPIANGNRVKLTWNLHLGATSYTIDRDGSPIVAGLAANEFNDTNVAVCASYTYTVYGADDTVGSENISDPATLVVTVPGMGC